MARYGVIRLQAFLLYLELRAPLEHCGEQVERVLRNLPGAKKVLFGTKTLGILFLPANVPEILVARVRVMLDADFADWTVIEVGKWSLSKNGRHAAFETWMDNNVRPSNWREMRKSKDVTLPQWRKTGN